MFLWYFHASEVAVVAAVTRGKTIATNLPMPVSPLWSQLALFLRPLPPLRNPTLPETLPLDLPPLDPTSDLGKKRKRRRRKRRRKGKRTRRGRRGRA